MSSLALVDDEWADAAPAAGHAGPLIAPDSTPVRCRRSQSVRAKSVRLCLSSGTVPVVQVGVAHELD
jgi:hypothetical protein